MIATLSMRPSPCGDPARPGACADGLSFWDHPKGVGRICQPEIDKGAQPRRHDGERVAIQRGRPVENEGIGLVAELQDALQAAEAVVAAGGRYFIVARDIPGYAG
jgi:hypothetical protein